MDFYTNNPQTPEFVPVYQRANWLQDIDSILLPKADEAEVNQIFQLEPINLGVKRPQDDDLANFNFFATKRNYASEHVSRNDLNSLANENELVHSTSTPHIDVDKAL